MHETPCLTFAVARGGARALGLSDAVFERIVERAFERWQRVDCGRGQPPGLVVLSAGIVTASEPYACAERSLNQSVWLISDGWAHNPDALGNTGVVMEENSGRIFDADVELQLEKILRSAPEGSIEDVLLTIATHEAGHVLGLDHSDDPSAVMAARYSDGDLLQRDLNPDDIDGICEIFPPEGFPNRCPTPGVAEAALNERACKAAIREMKEREEEEERALRTSPGCEVSASSHLRSAGVAVWPVLGWMAWLRTRRRPRNVVSTRD